MKLIQLFSKRPGGIFLAATAATIGVAALTLYFQFAKSKSDSTTAAVAQAQSFTNSTDLTGAAALSNIPEMTTPTASRNPSREIAQSSPSPVNPAIAPEPSVEKVPLNFKSPLIAPEFSADDFKFELTPKSFPKLPPAAGFECADIISFKLKLPPDADRNDLQWSRSENFGSFATQAISGEAVALPGFPIGLSYIRAVSYRGDDRAESKVAKVLSRLAAPFFKENESPSEIVGSEIQVRTRFHQLTDKVALEVSENGKWDENMRVETSSSGVFVLTFNRPGRKYLRARSLNSAGQAISSYSEVQVLEISTQRIAPSPALDSKPRTETERDDPVLHHLRLWTGYSFTSLSFSDPTTGGGGQLQTNQDITVGASWIQSWSEKLASFEEFSLRSVNVQAPTSNRGLTNAQPTLFGLKLGLERGLGQRFLFRGAVGYENDISTHGQNVSSITIDSVSQPTAGLGFDFKIYQQSATSIYLGASDTYLFGASTDAYSLSSGQIYSADLTLRQIMSKFSVDFILRAQNRTQNSSILSQNEQNYGGFLRFTTSILNPK